MQRSPQEIKDALLKALDQDYNVINMPVVIEIIGILEQTSITKETLEATRLGKYINELRRKTSNVSIAKRAKDLVRKWRNLIVPETATGGNGIRALHKPLQGQLSPGLPGKSAPASPASRVSSLSPDTKSAPSPAISPRLQGYSPLPSAPLDNGTPRGRGRPPKPANAAAAAAAAAARAASPSPQPDPPPRQRGRPPKNKNKNKRPASSPSDLVPKTSAANKRLRKSSPVRANGLCANQVPNESVPMLRKVKTTRELLQSIQQESSLDQLRSKTLVSLGVAKAPEKVRPSPSATITKTPEKFLKSPAKFLKREKSPTPPPSPTGSEIVDVEVVDDSPVKPKPEKPETVEEILARLPPVDPDSIRWSESEEDEETEPVVAEVTSEDVARLHGGHIECLNGNRTDGVTTVLAEEAHGLKVPIPGTYGRTERTCESSCTFREWHETLSRSSYQGELLHILPYVIID